MESSVFAHELLEIPIEEAVLLEPVEEAPREVPERGECDDFLVYDSTSELHSNP